MKHFCNRMLIRPLLVVFSLLSLSLSAQESTDSEKIALADSIYAEGRKYQISDPEKAKEFYTRSIDLIDAVLPIVDSTKPYLYKKANAYRVLAGYNAMDDKPLESLEMHEKSLAIKREIGDRESQVLNYQQLASLWGTNEDYEKAGIAADSAYRIALETQSKKYLSNAARGKAAFFRATEQKDSADHYFRLAIRASEDSPNKIPGYAALDMYSRFLREQGKTQESLTYLNQFLDKLKDNNDTIFFTSAYLSRAEMQLALNNPDAAIENFEKGIFYAEKTNQRDDLIEMFKGLTQSYELKGNYRKAYESKKLYFDEYKRRRDTSAFRERAEIALKYEYDLKKAVDSTNFAQQKLIDESELKRKANTKFWIVVTALLVILFLALAYYLIQRRKAAEYALRNEYLSAEVDTKTEEINELLTETIQHIKSKERIAENLQKLSKEEEGISLKSILVELQASKADNAKLMLVKQNIEKVNYGFIKNLKEKHRNLTNTDLEICSFIRIGLNRKQIAALRNTSIAAIKSSRFRLKKKLSLSPEDSLDDYINSL
ncbi:hypothetical protein POV27_02155 [Aureisphaera galaxeae]|uniref:hypothetical protein n=1 Tax=Aureisphaera galaxeae TaxID=1538023 RepID=UPI00234FD894|nr:hypothetical protein [Aureisphaera galaxeae]MDC8002844.1 hypothetical protein [Aureisphaera galaxeae]